jgi:ribose/xylose/arabinose/galactoside ABC-type transport system permease subunit
MAVSIVIVVIALVVLVIVCGIIRGGVLPLCRLRSVIVTIRIPLGSHSTNLGIATKQCDRRQEREREEQNF